MKKAILYSLLLLISFSCVESDEVIIPKELMGKWEKEFTFEEDTYTVSLLFQPNGTYESFAVRTIQTEALQAGILGHSKGNFSL